MLRFSLRSVSRRVRWGALVVSVGLVAGLLAGCEDAETASGAMPDGPDLRNRFMASCVGQIPRVDCECFWQEGAAAFTHGNMAPLVSILIGRVDWSGQITRARIDQVAGIEGGRVINRALYACVKM